MRRFRTFVAGEANAMALAGGALLALLVVGAGLFLWARNGVDVYLTILFNKLALCL
jgi:hypothetical protein